MVTTVKFQPKYGNYLMTSGFDNQCKLWSFRNFNLIRTFSDHEARISCSDFSPDFADQSFDAEEQHKVPKRFASASFDRTFKLYEYDTIVDMK